MSLKIYLLSERVFITAGCVRSYFRGADRLGHIQNPFSGALVRLLAICSLVLVLYVFLSFTVLVHYGQGWGAQATLVSIRYMLTKVAYFLVRSKSFFLTFYFPVTQFLSSFLLLLYFKILPSAFHFIFPFSMTSSQILSLFLLLAPFGLHVYIQLRAPCPDGNRF